MPRLLLAALALGAAGFVALAAPASAQWAPTGGPPGGRFHDLAAPEGALLGAHSWATFASPAARGRRCR